MAGSVTLPIEVMGPGAVTKAVRVIIQSNKDLSSPLFLRLEIHGLEYETQASVSVNGGSWIAITSQSAFGPGKSYGGIGGGFNTLPFAVPLPTGSLKPGNNDIYFRFNGSDGNSSGYRVLALNIVANGQWLLPSSAFTEDNPSDWRAPYSDPANIAAGESLWRTAALLQPTAQGGSQQLQAHCGDCHAQDGRDLKYFNYSNNSIINRAQFHGLNETQATQIASYIRSLSTPAPGNARPWNPPYQPGPGLDSQPASQWSAGAGLRSVLSTDAQAEPYLVPGGSTANWSANQYLNVRELPIAMQLPDWNHWLPRIHPLDGFGSSFANSNYAKFYPIVRSELSPNNRAAYQSALGDISNWFVGQDQFLPPMEFNVNWNANNWRAKIYAAALWQAVKLWEINQEFGLEGMPEVPYGGKADLRSWFGSRLFRASPNSQQIPAGAGLGNGSTMVRDYLSYAWYYNQLIVNDGNGTEHGSDPVDFPYVYGFVFGVANDANRPAAMMQFTWLVKALQEETQNGHGPDQGSLGWQPSFTIGLPLVNPAWATVMSTIDASTRATLSQAYTSAWFQKASQYTPQQYYTGGWANRDDDPRQLNPQVTFGGIMWYMLPRLRFYGVDPSMTYQISAWAATIWPKGDWSLNNKATCVNPPNTQCTSD